MILQPYTFNGTSLSSTDYEASFPRASANLQLTANPSYIKRAGAVPVYSGKDFQPVTLVLEIEMQHDYMTMFESLNRLFDVKDETPRQFICTDEEDSDKQYYVYATAKQVQGGHDGPMATVTLAVDDPIWTSVTQNSQTWSTTSSTSSTDVTAGGNDYSYPIFEITPTSAPSTDYLYNMHVQVLPTSSAPYPGRYLDITGSTDTTWDTAALVTAGKMQADGDDLRVFRDGIEIDRWLDGINTTDTHVIVVADMPPAYDMILKTAIGATDTVTEVELTYTSANMTAISALPNSGRLILDSALGSTNTEEFTYTAKTITDTRLAFTVNTRAARGTTGAAHAASSNVRYLPYDFNILYGYASATAPVTDDTRKPIQDLTSRNHTFVYTSFYDTAGKRAGIWKPDLQTVSDPTNSRSRLYTGTNDGGDTDPAAVIGAAAYTYQALGAWKADSIVLAWLGYFPDLVASITSASGAQTQNSAITPYVMGVYGFPDLPHAVEVFSIAAQSATDYGTWTNWSKSSSDAPVPPNSRYLSCGIGGTQLGSTDVYTKMEMTAITLTLTNYPHVMLRSEASNNKIDITLGNQTTGESIRIVYPLPLNGTLTVDTSPDFPTAKYNGQVVNGAVSLSSVRAAWLRLQPGSNTLTYDNNLSAASDITIVIRHYDRMSFL